LTVSDEPEPLTTYRWLREMPQEADSAAICALLSDELATKFFSDPEPGYQLIALFVASRGDCYSDDTVRLARGALTSYRLRVIGSVYWWITDAIFREVVAQGIHDAHA
jgi:hypothetical protein